MRTECYNSHFAYGCPLPIARLVAMVGNSILLLVALHPYRFPFIFTSVFKQPYTSNLFYFYYNQTFVIKLFNLTNQSESQVPTQRYGRRPFGVGLLVAGYDVSMQKFYYGIYFYVKVTCFFLAGLTFKLCVLPNVFIV